MDHKDPYSAGRPKAPATVRDCSDEAIRQAVRDAFDSVSAEEALKEATLNALRPKMAKRQPGLPFFRLRPVFSAALCSFFLIFGSFWLYFTPTARISLDINPSIELGVNRFDRIVSLTGYNEDGRILADEMDIRFSDYTEAVSRILEHDTVTKLLEQDELLEISVIGPDNSQCTRIYSNLQGCTVDRKNTHCHRSHIDEVSQAHDHGLSYGKYRAYLQILELDPATALTPEQVQSMTMRELYELELQLSGGISDPDNMPDENPSGASCGVSGKTHGHHHRQSGNCN